MFAYRVVAVIFVILIEPKLEYVTYEESRLENDFVDKDLCCNGENSKKEEKEEKDDWIQVDVTEFAIHLFPLLSRFIVETGLDPVRIPDMRHSFRLSFLPLPATYSEFIYYFLFGSLHYLSDIEQNSTVIATYRDKTLSIDATIAYDSIMLTCDYYVKLLFLCQRGWMRAEAISVSINIVVDYDINARKLSVNKLKLNNIESIQISVHGNYLVEQLITPFSNVVTFILKNALIKEIERQATIMLREGFQWINDIVFPWNIFQSFGQT